MWWEKNNCAEWRSSSAAADNGLLIRLGVSCECLAVIAGRSSRHDQIRRCRRNVFGVDGGEQCTEEDGTALVKVLIRLIIIVSSVTDEHRAE